MARSDSLWALVSSFFRRRSTSAFDGVGGDAGHGDTRMEYTCRSTEPGSLATRSVASFRNATFWSSALRSYLSVTDLQAVIDLILGLVQQIAEGVRAVGLYELVRVLGPGHAQHAHLHVQLFQQPMARWEAFCPAPSLS
jgi:hypothetical protein